MFNKNVVTHSLPSAQKPAKWYMPKVLSLETLRILTKELSTSIGHLDVSENTTVV